MTFLCAFLYGEPGFDSAQPSVIPTRGLSAAEGQLANPLLTPTRGLSAAEGQFPMTSLYITQPDAQLSKPYEAFKVALKQDVHVYYEIVRPKQDF